LIGKFLLGLLLFQGVGGHGGFGGKASVGGGVSAGGVVPATNLLSAYLPSSLSSSPVTSWTDYHAGTRNLTSAGTSAPVWAASQTPHGNPAVTFDGTDNYFGVSTSAIPIGSNGSSQTDGTIYMLVKFASVSAKQSLTSNTGGAALVYAITSGALQTAELQQTSSIGTDVTTLSAGTWYRLAFSWSGGTNWKFYVNGVLTNSGTTATSFGNGLNTIGANFSGSTAVEFFDGQVGFLGFYSGAYDSAVDSYMAAL
jgi:hypothetical protein